VPPARKRRKLEPLPKKLSLKIIVDDDAIAESTGGFLG
jgi:hypothetical protein